MSEDRAKTLVEHALANLDDVDVPPQVADSVARHNRHLFDLASNLVRSGMSEDAIKQVLDRAMESYKEELIQTVLTVRQEGGDG